MNVRRMDAHGGWISTPRDLLRFVRHVDGVDQVPDHIRAPLLQRLYRPYVDGERFGRGWFVRDGNAWHDGTLPGTSAVLVRTHDGFAWAGLANSRPHDRDARVKLDRLMWDIRRTISFWPPVNSF